MQWIGAAREVAGEAWLVDGGMLAHLHTADLHGPLSGADAAAAEAEGRALDFKAVIDEILARPALVS